MTGKTKKLFALAFAVLFAASILFISAGESVWAKDSKEKPETKKEFLENIENNIPNDWGERENGVHANPSTFGKDFDLSVDQKEWTIMECEKIVNEILDPEMSDLEKYYTLAVWLNQNAPYDWEFWAGGYNFDYYSHQWDTYGSVVGKRNIPGKEPERAVCAGIAVTYSVLCHAADLPCKFVRLKPGYLDHTINYIPDINGHAYYVDVTENVFLMSEDSISACKGQIDTDCSFAKIEKACDDKSFDYRDGEVWSSTDLKYDCFDLMSEDDERTMAKMRPFKEWFAEFAEHKQVTRKQGVYDTTGKTFGAEYEEKGSGTDGTHYASYRNKEKYPSNFTASPDVWFLDDFYAYKTSEGITKENPDENVAEIKEKIQNKVFDERLLNISGIDKSFECDITQLEREVVNNIHVEYFPTADQDGNIVAVPANLSAGINTDTDKDFTVSLTSYNNDTHTAILTLKGNGKAGYNGEQKISVQLKSATITKAPTLAKELIYNGKPQELVNAGEAGKNCEMQYALGNKTKPTEEFSTAIPTAINAGQYYVWYKAVYKGEEADPENPHADSIPQCIQIMEKNRPTTLLRKQLMIHAEDITLKKGESATISPKPDVDEAATFTFENSDKDIASVDKNGKVTGLKAGQTDIEISGVMDDPNSNYVPEYYITITVTVTEEKPEGNPEGNKSDVTSVAGKETQIMAIKKDKDLAGSTFRHLRLKGIKSSKTANKLSWTKVKGASGYYVYGNRCGSSYQFKRLAFLEGGAKNTWTHKKLKKGTYYKYIVIAYKVQSGVQKVIATSKTIHVATSGGKVGNYRSVKLNKKSIVLKKNKTFKLKARAVVASKKLKVKKHRKVAFESSNKKVAIVNAAGKIKALQKGACYVYAYTQSGTFARVKVKVK